MCSMAPLVLRAKCILVGELALLIARWLVDVASMRMFFVSMLQVTAQSVRVQSPKALSVMEHSLPRHTTW